MSMGVHLMSTSNLLRLPHHVKPHVKFSPHASARPIRPIQALCGPFVPSKLSLASGAQGIPGVCRLQIAARKARRSGGGDLVGRRSGKGKRMVAMAQLPGLFPNPEGWLIVALELATVYAGLSAGYNEASGGKNLGYSKFANTGTEDKKTRIPSKWGMFLLYAPAALLGSTLLAHRLGLISLTPVAELFGASGVAAILQSAVDFPDLRVLLVISALTIHFWKRVLEVLFVHKFSGTTVLKDALSISGGYCFSVGTYIYVQLLSPSLPGPSPDLMYLGLALFIIGLTGNGYHHWLLANLRKPGDTKKYVVPTGGLFGELVCPHYAFEILDFIGIGFMCQTIQGWCNTSFVVFYLLGRTLQTKQWYLKKVDGFPETRKILIPRVF